MEKGVEYFIYLLIHGHRYIFLHMYHCIVFSCVPFNYPEPKPNHLISFFLGIFPHSAFSSHCPLRKKHYKGLPTEHAEE